VQNAVISLLHLYEWLRNSKHTDPWHSPISNHNINLWHSDLKVNACRGPAVDYISSNFGVDSSSHFPLKSTDKHTDRQTHRHNPYPIRQLIIVNHTSLLTFQTSQSTANAPLRSSTASCGWWTNICSRKNCTRSSCQHPWNKHTHTHTRVHVSRAPSLERRLWSAVSVGRRQYSAKVVWSLRRL